MYVVKCFVIHKNQLSVTPVIQINIYFSYQYNFLMQIQIELERDREISSNGLNKRIIIPLDISTFNITDTT